MSQHLPKKLQNQDKKCIGNDVNEIVLFIKAIIYASLKFI